jgi:hypothetical protein
MNNIEREQWVNNDESLYNNFKHSRLSMTKFIRANRSEIDQYINQIINKKPGE